MKNKRHNDAHISEVIEGYFSGNNKLSDKFIQNQIRKIWPEKMGSMINGYTKSLSYYKGILRIELTAAALKNEMMMERERVASIINEALNKKVVKDIVIK